MRWTILHSTGRWLILGCVTGVMAALLALMYLLLVDLGAAGFINGIAGYAEVWPHGEPKLPVGSEESHINPWLLLLVISGGGLAAGGLVQLFIGEDNNTGDTDYVVEAYHRNRGLVRVRYWLTKFFAAIITMMCGGSVGREGPIILAGGTAGSLLGQASRQPSRNRRILLIAGAAGGIAAAFQAPLAGALYAGEVLYSDSDLDADALIPSIISAIVGYCVFGLLEMGIYPAYADGVIALFYIPALLNFGAHDFPQLIGYGLVAVGGLLASYYMRWVFPLAGKLVKRIPVPFFIRTGIGAGICGLIAIAAMEGAQMGGLIAPDSDLTMSILSAGYGILQHSFDFTTGTGTLLGMSPMAIAGLMLLIALCKVPATAFVIGSGCSGGIFGPSMVVGGCVGGAIGFMLDGLIIAPPIAACVVMGMAAILAANFKAPLASLLMVCELTGSYGLLLPAMWVSATAFLFSGSRGLVRSQVSSAVDSPAHQGHFFTDILAGITVEPVFDPERSIQTLHPDSSLDECKRLVTQTEQHIYPVVNEADLLVGIFSIDDLRSFLYDEALGLVAVAQDIATSDIATICLDDSLATAMRRFTEGNLEALPVVKADDDRHFVGLLERREVVDYYNRVVERMRKLRREDGWETAPVRS